MSAALEKQKAFLRRTGFLARPVWKGRAGKPVLRLVALAAFLIIGCHLPGEPDPKDRPVAEDRVLSFAVLFKQNCAGCHGADGKMGPAPPLNDPIFRALVPDKAVEEVISMGRPGTPMPAFAVQSGGKLTAEQVQVLVHEIKGTSYKVGEREIVPAWGSPGPAPEGAPPYLAAKAQGNQAGSQERGAKVFARACADCHGEQGRGVLDGGRTIRTLNDPVFLALVSDQGLRRFVITGRPDLGMPNYREPRPHGSDFKALTGEDVNDLVALLAYWRQGGVVR